MVPAERRYTGVKDPYHLNRIPPVCERTALAEVGKVGTNSINSVAAYKPQLIPVLPGTSNSTLLYRCQF